MYQNTIAAATKKLTSRQWTNIEKADPYLRNISIVMSKFGFDYGQKGSYSESEIVKKNFSIDGDIYQELIRNMFIDRFSKLIPDFMLKINVKDKKKNKNKKHGSGQQLKKEIRYKKVREFINKDLDLLEKVSHKYPVSHIFECQERL